MMMIDRADDGGDSESQKGETSAIRNREIMTPNDLTPSVTSQS
jgi:hypothetical protein